MYMKRKENSDFSFCYHLDVGCWLKNLWSHRCEADQQQSRERERESQYRQIISIDIIHLRIYFSYELVRTHIVCIIVFLFGWMDNWRFPQSATAHRDTTVLHY